VPSLASAAALLANCSSSASLERLFNYIGFSRPLVPVTVEGIETLGLPAEVTAIMISQGDGYLRALAFEIAAHADVRATIARVASRLASRAPQMHWVLGGVQVDCGEVFVAAFDAGRSRPRVAALVANRHSIVDSDSETVCALASANAGNDVLTHLRWLDVLGRDSVNRRFFRELERLVGHLAAHLVPRVAKEDSAELALLYASRLLFLSFLETKGWLDRDHGFLGNHFADCMLTGGGYHKRVLSPLFFGTLNTHPRNRAQRARSFGRVPFLNGGLFARSSVERRTSGSFFTDEAIGDLFSDLLTRYRFTAREDTTTWSEAAIDPEMLGKAFESLMSSAERKTSGAFYTPQSLVREVSASALAWGLTSPATGHETVVAALRGDIPPPTQRRALLELSAAARILDPACGSGAFLVHLLEEVSALRVRLGDLRSLHVIRREVLTRSIFGVDINPVAVWLCELRLWLSMAIEDPETDPMRVSPLPNLDRNIRVGDSLAGDATWISSPVFSASRITAMRARYSRATGPRKRSLSKSLDRLERECAVKVTNERATRLKHERREILSALRSRDLFGERRPPSREARANLERIRRDLRAAVKESRSLAQGGALPFSFATHFADVAARGGFDVIAGNPPWVRTHNLDPGMRAALRDRFFVYRNSAWMGGSEASAAGKGFSSQVDIAALFIERCRSLMHPDGTFALIVPAKLWRSLAGGGVRSLLHERSQIREIHDLSDSPHLFEAAVYPSVIVASARRDGMEKPCGRLRLTANDSGTKAEWTIPADRLAFDSSQGSPWLLLPRDVRAAFDAMKVAGIPLASTPMGRPLLGVKTGLNAAFLLQSADASVEPCMLRPAIRGNQMRKWAVPPHESRIVWTHGIDGNPLRSLPPKALRHLTHWRSELDRRTDARNSARWWSLFRVESADHTHARVVWADIDKSPHAAVLPAGDVSVPMNSCYCVRCANSDDAFALAALLNSSIAAAWLDVLAEPARGGFRRYLGWTMSLLPVPRDWQRARSLLAPLGRRAFEGALPDDTALLEAALGAYDLAESVVTPLLAWNR
jgi:hypothetical protein